ncbi:TVP38/TMEM64 family protein [Synechococcus sp. B60.2]|uniref:TVP38/TMEM64 family protein n=1 Tax=unclassified Synechococcus TaxID=2626047 RepID=UPI0039C04530
MAEEARHLGLSTHAYLQQKTGWILRNELYYPPGTAFGESAGSSPTSSEKLPSSSRTNSRKRKDILSLLLLLVVLVAAILLARRLDPDTTREFIAKLGPWAPLALIGLRSLSIIIPAIPSTVYSILAGALFGFGAGILYIAIADFTSCTLNFYLARKFGRGLVQRMVGRQWMYKVDALSANYLENNIFLTAGFLMTGLFDFVAYAAGLTQMKWQNFLLALALGIAVSTPPVVALGAGILEQGRWLLGFALLGMFALAMLTGWLSKRRRS